MSSEGSSRLRQFGLYKTIDTQTAEFLKLSRKRQIRRGCACAAVSTAITVTVVVVILLIYEYGIAVESSLVQNIYSYGNLSLNGSADSPVADRLDRSYFGFDQDYYERMPLLVNAMQENHYIDPFLETAPTKRARLLRNKTKTAKPTSIRRTSPRPFIFELRSPTPTPFSRTFGSKSWVESYRNAQRLENLQQVIQYLEKTINAKFGDLYELPSSSSSTHIAFSGVYVKPSSDTSKEVKPTTPTLDLLLQSSNKVETRNHVSDPLFSFKPDSPGDVNLLADGFLRFAPSPTLDKPTTPMFRPISNRKKQDNEEKNVVDAQASEIKNIETSTVDKPNSFKVMLNYVPTKTTIDYSSSDGTSSAINKVYFTTSRPVRFQFKRKSNGPVRRMYMPRSLKRPIINRTKASPPKDILRKSSANKEATMIVHVNLYPQKTVVKEVVNVTENKQEYTTTPATTTTPVTTTTEVNTGRPLTQAPELSFTQVEDHHVGSSGVIPVEHRTVPPPPLPPVSFIPTFETTVSSTSEIYSWPTNPPEVVKFSPEDAKVPDYYHRSREMESRSYTTEVNSRTFNLHDVKFQDHYDQLKQAEGDSKPIGYNSRDYNSEESEIINNYGRFGEKEMGGYAVNVDSRPINPEYTRYIDAHRFRDMDSTTEANRRNFRDSLQIQETVEPSTLVVKLKNEVKLKTTTTEETISEVEDSEEATTVQTYVPQINGHYRSVNQNSRMINDWFDKEDENDRKKKLETRVTGLKKPTYVEIKRNNTNINNDDDDDESEE
ncbi:uncharacterized protein LOC125226406 [Leguminivora glycinivorella]|uniref:uncharacterized protein LOC125226406 n=1 Tax=Leguminivora glycinivorella TaxID=1035111 RepID=UPI00200CB206|nr:uncharacterized protein LOC125226406 [Leguminivora glycinivorella]